MSAPLDARAGARARTCRTLVPLAAVFACTVVPYVVTVDRGVDFGDYGDFQLVPYILGIAYPSGFPGYTILGWVWSHAIPLGSVALRMNLLSVFTAALANVFVAGLLMELSIPAVVSLIAAVLYGLLYQAWAHSGAANAHEVGTALLVASLCAVASWARSGSGAALTATALTYASSMACDNSTVLALPGLLLMVSCRGVDPRHAARLAIAGIAIVGLAYAYLPLRSAYVTSHNLDPARAIGLAEGDHQFWDQGHPSTFDNFFNVTSGGGFHAPGAFGRMLQPKEVLRTWNDLTGQVTTAFGPFALALAIVAVVIFIRERGRFAVGIALVSLLTALYITAWHGESDVTRYAPRALLLVVTALAWWYARISRARTGLALAGRVAFMLLVISVIVVEAANASRVGRDRSARDASAVAPLLRNIPPGSVLIAPWKYAAPIAYRAYVEGDMPKAVVVCCTADIATPHLTAWTSSRRVMFVNDATAEPVSPGIAFQQVGTSADLALWRLHSTRGSRNRSLVERFERSGAAFVASRRART